jgi:transposase
MEGEGRCLISFIQKFYQPFLEELAMTAAMTNDCTARGPVLYVAFEMGWTEWKLGFAPGSGVPARLRCIGARNLEWLEKEIAKAKERFGLPADCAVRSCYEAGRDGFWLHRYLTAKGIDNVVVDSASIQVNRRARRAKSDALDAAKLLVQLVRHHGGEKGVWSVVRVPSESEEDQRQLHRELLTLKEERTEHINRIKGLLAGWGLAVEVKEDFPAQLEQLRTWDDQAVLAELRQRLLREFGRWQLVQQQIRELDKERKQRIRHGTESEVGQVRQLLGLAGIGVNGAWLFVREVFGWRRIRNRRELAALAGLAPTPYQSGDRDREQGISKAGNRRLRTMLVEIAWGWLRWQPQSALSRWYQERFAKGSSRQRRIGIVALARKILVALWRYLETGEVPQDALVVGWQAKLHLNPELNAG